MNLLEDLKNPLWYSQNIIYLYTNKINNKKYVGQVNGKTKNLNNRHKRHMRDNLIIDIALRKYGEDNFSLEIIHFGETLEELNYFEEYYIKYFDTLAKNNKGYNVSTGGSKGNPFGGKTEEEKRKIFDDVERNKKIGESHKGRKQSEESNEKRRKTLLEQRENTEMIIYVGQLWNEHKNVTKIIEITKLHRATICRYLKKCNEIGVCDYNGSNATAIHTAMKIVVVDNNGDEFYFDSMKQCEKNSQEVFGIKFCHLNRYIDKKPYKGYIIKSVE